MSNRYKTPTSSDNENDVVNFADAFQKEDLDIKNLIFKEENRNDKIKNEDRIIKDEE